MGGRRDPHMLFGPCGEGVARSGIAEDAGGDEKTWVGSYQKAMMGPSSWTLAIASHVIRVSSVPFLTTIPVLSKLQSKETCARLDDYIRCRPSKASWKKSVFSN
jgi:hypothetical protein